MMTLHQTQPTVQQLLSSNDFVGALDVIATAQDVLKKEMSGITSFRYHNHKSYIYFDSGFKFSIECIELIQNLLEIIATASTSQY